jgi:hypothetical protein
MLKKGISVSLGAKKSEVRIKAFRYQLTGIRGQGAWGSATRRGGTTADRPLRTGFEEPQACNPCGPEPALRLLSSGS